MNELNQVDLPRRLGVSTAALAVAGTIVGSGIFRTPAEIAAQTGSPGAMLLVWIVGGLIVLCFALSLSELSTMFPRSGGMFVYLREAYGERIGFIYGWNFMLVNPTGWAGVAMVFAEYAGRLAGLDDTGRRLLAGALIVFMSAANYRSVHVGAALQNVSTIAKLLAILSLAICVFVFGSGGQGALSAPLDWQPASITGLLLAMVSVLWAYDGATAACSLAGEVRDPHRNLPRALLLGVGGVIALYLVINVAYLYVLPFIALPSSPLVAADAAGAALGRGAEALVSALVMVSTFGTVAALVMSDPRVFFAMGRHGSFFASIGAVHRKHFTPHVAIVVHCVLTLLYVSLRSFEQLAAAFVLGQTPFYALAAWGVIRLRRMRPAADRPYRTLGYPVVPLVFIAAVVLIFANSLVLTPGVTGINVAIILSGFPVYWLWKRFASGPERG